MIVEELKREIVSICIYIYILIRSREVFSAIIFVSARTTGLSILVKQMKVSIKMNTGAIQDSCICLRSLSVSHCVRFLISRCLSISALEFIFFQP